MPFHPIRPTYCNYKRRIIQSLHLSLQPSLVSKISTSMRNITLHYNLEDLNIFTPELKGWSLHLFTVSSIAIVIITIITQITVYRSLKRLGPRPINQLIVPSQVSKIYEFESSKQLFPLTS